MSAIARLKKIIDRPVVRSVVAPVMSQLARSEGRGVRRIFYEDGVWIHETSGGYFAYPHPYVRLDLEQFEQAAKRNFFWGYQPGPGDVVMDIGAGVGEETLTFSRAVGDRGVVVCVEAHPRTFRCLEKLVKYNRLKNVQAVQGAVTGPSCSAVVIEDCDEYLANRLNSGHGFTVPATTIDAICARLNVDHIDFLKMNIEGAERFAIQGVGQTLKKVGAFCISCHDFLAGDESLRTKALVRKFLADNGFEVAGREDERLPPYLRDQVWGYQRTRTGVRLA